MLFKYEAQLSVSLNLKLPRALGPDANVDEPLPWADSWTSHTILLRLGDREQPNLHSLLVVQASGGNSCNA